MIFREIELNLAKLMSVPEPVPKNFVLLHCDLPQQANTLLGVARLARLVLAQGDPLAIWRKVGAVAN